MSKRFDVQKELTTIARNWPKPNGEFVFFLERDHMWLHKIRLPDAERGQGTKKMAEILSITDRANLLVCLTADPIFRDDDEPPSTTNPDTFELVRWYMRFGFIPHGPTEDGFVMERPAKMGSTVNDILLQYAQNKRKDITLDEFNRRWVMPKFKKHM